MRGFLVMTGCLMLALPAFAHPDYVDQVPGGATFDCNLCHTSGGGTARNSFGEDVEDNRQGDGANAKVEWLAIFDKDSDGDGLTNGEELGDACGDWKEGDRDDAEASHPGKAGDTRSEAATCDEVDLGGCLFNAVGGQSSFAIWGLTLLAIRVGFRRRRRP